MGQIERLLPPRPSARYVIRQETFARTNGNGREVPFPTLPSPPRNRGDSPKNEPARAGGRARRSVHFWAE
jgi:hypothetical protein